jgi:TetR/AcrR family transcriptional repressor of uid operon
MRRANAQLLVDRRTAILDAAQHCFARAGFHQTSMHEICAEASMSAGNLYRYFPSKEALIAGIAERNRAEAAESFAAVDKAPTFFEGLAALARRHLVEREEEIALCAEIMAESRRNPAVAKVHEDIERDIKARLVDMLKRGAARGEVSADIDFDGTATFLMVLGDGMFWRRAVEPGFDAQSVLPLVLQAVRCVLTQGAQGGAQQAAQDNTQQPNIDSTKNGHQS